MTTMELNRSAVCSLSDSKIRMMGKRFGAGDGGEEDCFLTRCRIRADRLIAAEAAQKDYQTCSLLADRAAALKSQQEAEAALNALPEVRLAESPLHLHKAEKRLKKQIREAQRQVRNCEMQLEQMRISFAERQTSWESIYKEIESLYLQGFREGEKAHAKQESTRRLV